jgi:hypothetical protein
LITADPGRQDSSSYEFVSHRWWSGRIPNVRYSSATLQFEFRRSKSVLSASGVLPDLDKIADQLRTWSYQEG